MELFILPFDHRSSLIKSSGEKPTEKQKKFLREAKKIIYEAFLASRKKAGGKGAILVDEEYGKEILLNAKKRGIITLYTLEKSGCKEFTIQYKNWLQRIKKINPDYCKALVRFNPTANNFKQLKALKKVSSELETHGKKFLLEMVVQPVKKIKNYEEKIRPALMIHAIKQIQQAGIKPTIWKLEGVSSLKQCKTLVKLVSNVPCEGIIILGRGETKAKTKQWVKIGAKTKGVIGFAVGRTVFANPLKKLNEGKINRKKAIKEISRNYEEFISVWNKNKKR
ncbi:MAG: DUF2090 domain-containing protein [Candidatus Micrarchaeota archaeon]